MQEAKYCPLHNGACRSDCAMLMRYGDGVLCAIPMAAHELFIVAEKMEGALPREEEAANGEPGAEDL